MQLSVTDGYEPVISAFSLKAIFMSVAGTKTLFLNTEGTILQMIWRSWPVPLTKSASGKICFGGTTSKETGHDKVIAFLAGSPGEKAVETFRQLRNLLRANLGITVDELVMIKSNEIPKTSSGKLQRYKLMQRYNAGEFDGPAISPDSL